MWQGARCNSECELTGPLNIKRAGCWAKHEKLLLTRTRVDNFELNNYSIIVLGVANMLLTVNLNLFSPKAANKLMALIEPRRFIFRFSKQILKLRQHISLRSTWNSRVSGLISSLMQHFILRIKTIYKHVKLTIRAKRASESG